MCWRKKNGLLVKCDSCQEEIYRRPSARRSEHYYCSVKCNKSWQSVAGKNKNGNYIPCHTCGTLLYRTSYRLLLYKHQYCSNECKPYIQHGISSRLSQLGNHSKLETKFKEALQKRGINFIHQFRYGLGIADFFILPNIIIECDGKYWHKECEHGLKDEKKNQWLNSNGYQVFRFSELEINKDVDGCVSMLPLS